MHYFYSSLADPDQFILLDEEAAHAHVLRLKPGDTIYILNGVGYKYQCIIDRLDKKQVMGKVVARVLIEKPKPNVTIALSPTKSIERYEWFLEKGTELGVQSFIPVMTQKSERRQINLKRLNKIILSAFKQSGRGWLPSLQALIPYEKFIQTCNSEYKLIAHASGTGFREFAFKPDTQMTICIGPEGDFTDHELDFALQHDFQKISLGDYRLRTETAGVVVAALLANN